MRVLWKSETFVKVSETKLMDTLRRLNSSAIGVNLGKLTSLEEWMSVKKLGAFKELNVTIEGRKQGHSLLQSSYPFIGLMDEGYQSLAQARRISPFSDRISKTLRNQAFPKGGEVSHTRKEDWISVVQGKEAEVLGDQVEGNLLMVDEEERLQSSSKHDVLSQINLRLSSYGMRVWPTSTSLGENNIKITASRDTASGKCTESMTVLSTDGKAIGKEAAFRILVETRDTSDHVNRNYDFVVRTGGKYRENNHFVDSFGKVKGFNKGPDKVPILLKVLETLSMRSPIQNRLQQAAILGEVEKITESRPNVSRQEIEERIHAGYGVKESENKDPRPSFKKSQRVRPQVSGLPNYQVRLPRRLFGEEDAPILDRGEGVSMTL